LRIQRPLTTLTNEDLVNVSSKLDASKFKPEDLPQELRDYEDRVLRELEQAEYDQETEE
jgi:hypothetical protein